jgi:release factor glutamine methyltransferase
MRNSSFDRRAVLTIVFVAVIMIGCAEKESQDRGDADESSSAATPSALSTHATPNSGPKAEDTGSIGTSEQRREVEVAFFEKKIIVLPGVFEPEEAQYLVLPLMAANAELFRNKRVLEIGTGSGVVGIYAAKLGASAVVVTDINENAIASAKLNAERLGVASLIDQRLVSGTDTTAYAVIQANEVFDVIISNPPYSLDLDATSNNAVTDQGDLGFSIVDGLKEHLSSDGVAALFYDSFFYHLVMVKYAEHLGYAVESRRPTIMTAWATETLLNSYLARLLEHRGLSPDTFRFDRDKDDLSLLFVTQNEPDQTNKNFPPGWMFIRQKPNS